MLVGTRWLVREGLELFQRIAPRRPPKMQSLIRYHGVIFTNFKLRALVATEKAKTAIDFRLWLRPKGSPWRTDGAGSFNPCL